MAAAAARVPSDDETVYVALFTPGDFVGNTPVVKWRALRPHNHNGAPTDKLSVMQHIYFTSIQDGHDFGKRQETARQARNPGVRYKGLLAMKVAEIRKLKLSFMDKPADVEDFAEPPCPGHGHLLYFTPFPAPSDPKDTQALEAFAKKHAIIIEP